MNQNIHRKLMQSKNAIRIYFEQNKKIFLFLSFIFIIGIIIPMIFPPDYSSQPFYFKYYQRVLDSPDINNFFAAERGFILFLFLISICFCSNNRYLLILASFLLFQYIASIVNACILITVHYGIFDFIKIAILIIPINLIVIFLISICLCAAIRRALSPCLQAFRWDYSMKNLIILSIAIFFILCCFITIEAKLFYNIVG